MKSNYRNLKKATVMMLMIVSTTLNAWADGFSGSGTRQDPFIIATAQDWQAFADSVNNGNTFEHKFFSLSADISGITAMVGTEDNMFAGAFYGNGHTITMELEGTDDYVAPFRYVKEGIIATLNTAGTIDAKSYQCGSGIVGYSEDMIMFSCRSSVNIKSNIEDMGVHAGLLAHVANNLAMANCLFDGTIDAPDASYCGGLIGYCEASNARIINCLFNGTMLCDFHGSCEIYASFNTTVKCENCYSTSYSFLRIQANHTYATGSELAAMLGYSWYADGDKALPLMVSGDMRMCVISGLKEYYQYTGQSIGLNLMLTDPYMGTLHSGKQYALTSVTDSLGHPVTEIVNRGEYTLTFTGFEEAGMSGTISIKIRVTGLIEDSDGNLLIESEDDWNALAELVDDFGVEFDQVIKLTHDITITKPVGSKNDFTGKFDGCGHTINLAIPDDEIKSIAPFYQAKESFFSRIHITGNYNNPHVSIAGLVAYAEDELAILSCRSSINVTGTTSSDLLSYNGFVYHMSSGEAVFYNSVFDGNIQMSGKNDCSGFITSSSAGKLLFYTCLVSGTIESDSLHGGLFYSHDSGKNNYLYKNCYYKAPTDFGQGIRTSASGIELKELLGNAWIVSNNNVIPDTDDKNLNTMVGINYIDSYYHYNAGEPILISPSIMTNSFDILNGEPDFSVTFTDSTGKVINQPKDIGTYYITITGTGLYYGSIEKIHFMILKYPEWMEANPNYELGEDEFFYVIIPKNDTIDAVLPDADIKTFKVYNSNSRFIDSLNALLLTAPEGYKLNITGVYTPQPYGTDCLKIADIEDGIEQTIFYRYTDNDIFSGQYDVTPSEISLTSSGRTLLLNFSTYIGGTKMVNLTVTLIPDAPTLVNSQSPKVESSDWYLPDGRLLQGAPSPGTLYLQPGRKVIIIDN